MEKQLIARGQATILVQKDSYTIHQSVGEYIFPANNNGALSQAVTFGSTIKVTLGDDNLTNFTIGAVTKPAGFSAITVNNTNKTVTYSVAVGTTTMADSGLVTIPVTIAGQTYTITFSYAKAKTGAAGVDSNMLDWVSDWNSAKTVIGSQSVITPKLFAGVKNSNNTITGIAIGKFPLSTVNASGTVATETINGIYGFKDGYKTFAIDTTGSVLLGKGNQFIRYNPSNGKIEFGSEVTLNWVNAINTAKTEAINSAAATAQAKADAAKKGAVDAVRNDIADAKKAGTDAKAVADAITNKANAEGWATKLTYIGSTGIYTGTLSANTVNAVRINASQISTGTIDAARINVAALKTSLMTAGNIEALTLNVTKGKVGGWSLDADSIYRETKNNTSGAYTGASGSVCIGSNGIRGFKWRLDATGAGAVAGGNIAWDAAGNVTFGASVVLNWTNAANTAANNGKLFIRGTGLNHSTTRYILLNGTKVHESSSRGLVLSVINRSDLKAVSHTHYDVYASDTNCNSLATAMNALDSTKIVILTSFDAIRINATLSAAIQRCGGSDYMVTDARVPYALIGIPGIGKNMGLTSIYGMEASAPFAEISTVIVNGIPQGVNADGKLKTYLSGTGIYTGTLTAQQVNAVAINAGSITAGTLSADRIGTKAITAAKIAAGTITAAEINVSSIQASVVTAAAVNGLTCTFNKGTIGGWRINASQIYKNNIYLGADGSITNSTKWKLNNDGSGLIAAGNISWNAAGAVTFGASVSLQWKNDIESAKTANFGYRYAKTIIINGESNKYYPVIIKGGDQTVKRNLLVRRNYSEQAPDDWANSSTHKGGLILHLKSNFGGWGGSTYSWDIYELSETYCRMFAGAQHCGNSCMFAIYLRGGGTTGAKYHIYSDQSLESDIYSPSPIPRSPQIAYNSDLIFKSPKGSDDFYLAYAPASRTLTTDVENEIRRRRFIVLAQGSDTTLTAHPLTYISGTGIYTGTLTANQVNAVAINASSITAGTLSADRIAAGSINATKLNAASIKSDIINTAYINGLSCTFVRGTIGGWTINSSQIYKNNIYLGSDGGIYNGTKWKLGNDGSGQVANGNISWNAAGAVTFASSVSLNWTNAATNALNSAKSYADTKKTEAVNAAAADATAKTNAAKELALAMAFGKMMYRDPEFRNGNNSINVYNNNSNGMVTITRTGFSSAPNDSKTVLEIKTAGSATPGIGGFCFATPCSNRKVFIVRIIAKIPVGRNIQWASNAIGASGSSKWLTPNAGKGDWAEYIYKVTCGTSDFSSTNFFYLDGAQGTAAAPVIWHVAYATVFDTTSSERYTTTIDANGVYTGTVRAGQILVDSALVVGGSTYNGSISVRDAGNNVKATLDRTGITAVAGKIGGWNITSGAIYACAPAGGHRVYITSSGYLYNDDGTQDYWGLRADGSATFGYGKILFDNDGSGYVANQNIKWDAKGNVEIKGNITANSGLIAGFTISGNKLINTAADSSIEFSSMMGNASMTINSYSSLLSLRADSARTGIAIQTYATGAVGLSIIANAGSNFAIESYGPVQFGQRAGERWCVPGVLYIGCKYNSGNSASFSKIWGEGCNVTSSYHMGNAQYKFYHNLGHTNYTVFAQGCQNTGYYGFFRLLERASSYFVIQNVGSNGGPDGSPFDFVIYGRNKWY